MGVLVRALAYASLFIGFVLVFLPSRILLRFGAAPPERMRVLPALGVLLVVSGAAIALACILTFALVGRGTPAPFDPPRRLVVRGPYRYVRNPMYLGAGLALGGAAILFQSSPLAFYAAGFLLVTHLFVLLYEEPALGRAFGEEYERYRREVSRWIPRC
jgi:protein-S-isoprenylcysteine O-methyltransferase Ste14